MHSSAPRSPQGIVPIVLAWFVSPILTAIASAILFWVVRFTVLRRENAARRAFWVLPPAVVVTFFVCIYFVLTKVRRRLGNSLPDNSGLHHML